LGKLRAIADIVEKVSEKSGRIFCYLAFLIMFVTTSDVVARYIFNDPIEGAFILNRQLFGLFILIAGGYTMYRRDHIRIEILYDHFPPRLKTIAKWISLASAVSFLGVVVWQGSWMGLNSLGMRETWQGTARLPLYPLKLLIPAVAFLFLLQAIISLFRNDK
jgi:TRAP-type mannitol/chloroaromatic compound transport system permease small subunit